MLLRDVRFGSRTDTFSLAWLPITSQTFATVIVEVTVLLLSLATVSSTATLGDIAIGVICVLRLAEQRVALSIVGTCFSCVFERNLTSTTT